MRSSNTGRKTSSVASAVWHLAPSYWNQMLPLQFLWTKIRSTWPDNDRHWRPLLAHLRRKITQTCLWAKICTKQWLVLGASAFQCMRAVFLYPKYDNFACLRYVPVSLSHWMVNWLQLLNQLNFVWRHSKVQNSSQWCLRNVQLLRTMVNWCWWHTLSVTVAIFSGVRTVFGFSRFGYASFFHFFHKITNKRCWRCFSSSKIRMQFSHTFCNITMIIKIMSQYFPALFKRIRNHMRSAEG